MNKNLKIILFGIVAPVLVVLLNAYFSTPSSFEFGSNYQKEISITALSISLLSSILIVIKNHNFTWRLLGVFLIFIFSFWIYLGSMFSVGF